LTTSISFGAWLKHQRKVRDLTQGELAQRLGCATVTLQKIELDERRPSKQLAERLADILSIPGTERPAFLRRARSNQVADYRDVDSISSAVSSAPWAPVPHPRHNLAAQTTSFIGREREVSRVVALLRQQDVRLLTLTGPGGTGKTRVGLHVAVALLDTFADGVWFVNLAAIRDPNVVPAAIAGVLGVREVPGQQVDEQLRISLATKQLLLILDNFEQVVDAAALVADLLAVAPHLKVLATSRSVLGIYGEQLVAVPPLGLPKGEHDVASSEAVMLFLARARATNPDFALTPTNSPAIAELCWRLDGLPLAIELAAARCRLMSPQALLQRLESRLQLLTGGPRTLPARQQTLRATIDWSYDLLTPTEQVLFRRLAVFEGGWVAEAVEQICTSENLRPVEAIDSLTSLHDKSLLRVESSPDGEPRFSMLETIREYARERLTTSGEEAALRERHAHYYLSWLEAQKQANIRLQIELRNLDATVEWITNHGEWRLGLRWANATFRLTERLKWVSKAWKRWHQELVDCQEALPVHTRMEALIRLGQFAYWHDLPQAVVLLEEGLALARMLGDQTQVLRAVEWLAHAYRDQEQFTHCIPLYEECMAYAQAAGTPFDGASAHHCQSELALLQENYRHALVHAQASLPTFRELNIHWGIACALMHMGFAALHLGNDALATRCFPEALQVALNYDGGSHIRGALAGCAGLAMRAGASGTERAARLLGAIADGTMVHAHRRASDRLIAAAYLNHDAVLWEAAYAEGRRMTLEQAVAFALASVPHYSKEQ
jgi:predicted ATPase/transcriptional regulator with XRE-family HTH domain